MNTSKTNLTQPAMPAVMYRLSVDTQTRTYPTGPSALAAQQKLKSVGVHATVQPLLFRAEVRA